MKNVTFEFSLNRFIRAYLYGRRGWACTALGPACAKALRHIRIRGIQRMMVDLRRLKLPAYVCMHACMSHANKVIRARV